MKQRRFKKSQSTGNFQTSSETGTKLFVNFLADKVENDSYTAIIGG